MLKDRDHLMDDSDMYSLRDLLDIKNRTLLKFLHDTFQKWADHMKSCTVRCDVLKQYVGAKYNDCRCVYPKVIYVRCAGMGRLSLHIR